MSNMNLQISLECIWIAHCDFMSNMNLRNAWDIQYYAFFFRMYINCPLWFYVQHEPTKCLQYSKSYSVLERHWTTLIKLRSIEHSDFWRHSLPIHMFVRPSVCQSAGLSAGLSACHFQLDSWEVFSDNTNIYHCWGVL